MKKSTSSIIIGSITVFMFCLFQLFFSITRSIGLNLLGNPFLMIIGAGVIWITLVGILPAAIVGIILGIIGLKKGEKKYLSWLGIILNVVTILLIASMLK